MSETLHDHGRRLHDLEVALGVLVRAIAHSGSSPLVQEAARLARARGAKGAAELLEDDRVSAAYRR